MQLQKRSKKVCFELILSRDVSLSEKSKIQKGVQISPPYQNLLYAPLLLQKTYINTCFC